MLSERQEAIEYLGDVYQISVVTLLYKFLFYPRPCFTKPFTLIYRNFRGAIS